MRATVGPGEVVIRDKDKQADLEASGQTEDLAALNRDPDKAYEITKDKHVEIEYYLSDSSVKAALEAGVAITQVIGGLLDRLNEPALAAAIREGDIDPADALEKLRSGACFEQRSDVFNLWDWIVPSAYAAGCQLKTLSGKVITIHDRATCIEALGKALYAQAIGVWSNRDSLRQGLWLGVKDQGAEFIDLVSDPSGLIKSVGNVALEIAADPVAAGFKYGYDAADGLYEKSLLYLQALAKEDYEEAGRHLAGLAIDLAMKAAGGAGTAYTAVKTADKIAALKKIEKIEKSASGKSGKLEPNPGTRPGAIDAEAGGYSYYDQYKKADGSGWDWPSNLGFAGVPRETVIPVGTRLDRYGSANGSFLSPAGPPLDQRAMAPGSAAEKLHIYEVQKPLPAIQGEVAPAFGQPGGGTQVLPNLSEKVNVDWLVRNGYLREVN